MCTWMAALAIGGALASTVSNTIASNEQGAARRRAMQAERERQAQLNRKTRGLVQDTGDKYGSTKEAQADKTGELAEIFRAPADAINTDAGLLPDARGAVTAQNVKDARGKAADEAEAQGDARANFRAFGDVMGENAMAAGRNAADIGMYDRFKANSAAVLPLELEAANQAGGIWRNIADLSQLGSSIAMPLWLSGQDPGALASIFAPTVVGSRAPNGNLVNTGARGYYT